MRFYDEKILPRFCDLAMRGDELNGWRARTLAQARGRVLEIGFGTGMNARHYPRDLDALVVIDANPGMSELARRRLSDAGLTAQHELLSGERMPFSEATFDTVVVTFTLCSIDDVDAALREVRRVLKPGGALLFLEHNAADSAGARRMQRAITPIWKHFAGGCHLDRDAPSLVEASGLRVVDVERGQLSTATPVFGTIRRGRALKE